jgi:tetratricopeptide (TPR) repeat protein
MRQAIRYIWYCRFNQKRFFNEKNKLKLHMFSCNYTDITKVGTFLLGIFLVGQLPAQEITEPAGSGMPAAETLPAKVPTALGQKEPSTQSGNGSTGESGNSGNFGWRGTQFEIGNSTLARARFEKYLNAPESAVEQAKAYSGVVREISEILNGKGGEGDQQRIVKAWRLLYQAGEYEIDNRISETLAARIVGCWQANQKLTEIMKENQRLELERERHERAIRVTEQITRRDAPQIPSSRGTDRNSPALQQQQPAPPAVSAGAPSVKRLLEAEARLKTNEATTTSSRLTLKVEFQAMILQLFAQRRFEHVGIATDFYRYLFAGEEQTLQGAGNLRVPGIAGLDTKITTTALQAMTNEAIRDVNEAISVVDYHLDRNELKAATERLQEAFILGEFVPAIQTFSREKKQRLTDFVRAAGQLETALEVRDYDRASTLLEELGKLSRDFDPGKPRALIDISKQASNLTLKQALVAAHSGDAKGAQELIQKAAETWPNNPEIMKVTESLFAKSDIKNTLAADFDRYVAQNDFRAIFNDRFRMGTALAMDEERSKKLIEIMKRMERIEIAIGQAREFERTANRYGAWEILERVYREYPEDSELNRLRADFAIGALEYASALRAAGTAMQQEDYGSAMAQYLKAQGIYPAGLLADEGLKKVASLYLDKLVPAFPSTENTVLINSFP